MYGKESRVGVHVPATLYAAIKVRAAYERLTLKAFVEKLFKSYLREQLLAEGVDPERVPEHLKE